MQTVSLFGRVSCDQGELSRELKVSVCGSHKKVAKPSCKASPLVELSKPLAVSPHDIAGDLHAP